MALVEGFAGYSLPDDLLSGMGLAIGYSVLAAFPIIGGWLAELVWGGTFPGGEEFISRLYAAHVFILPLVIFGLIGLHLYMVVRHRHTQFAPGRQERNVIGSPAFPGYIMRSGACSSRRPACCCCWAARSRSTRSGSTASTSPGSAPTAPIRLYWRLIGRCG